MSYGLALSCALEEVVEDGGIDWSNSSLSIVVVISFYLGAAVVVAVFDEVLNEDSIVLSELFQGLIYFLQIIMRKREQEPVKLLLLVSLSVFFHHNAASQVLKEFLSELIQTL